MPSGADKVATNSFALLPNSNCQALQSVNALFHKFLCAALETEAAQIEKIKKHDIITAILKYLF